MNVNLILTNIHLTGTLVTIRGNNLDLHGSFDIIIGGSLCPKVTRSATSVFLNYPFESCQLL